MFIIEVIFGLLVYCWLFMLQVVVDIVVWCRECEVCGEVVVLFCYVLGKVQWVLVELLLLDMQLVLLYGVIVVGVVVYCEVGIVMFVMEIVGEQVCGSDFVGKLVLVLFLVVGSVWMWCFKSV